MSEFDAVLAELSFFDGHPLPVEVAQIRKCKLEATSALLGDTISLSDEQWQSPSRLPGWTRAHVAAHLSRNADAFSQVLEGLMAGGRPSLYVSPAERRWPIERDSMRSGLDQQIDLDTSFGRLNARLNEVLALADDHALKTDCTLWHRINTIPLARLSETIIHHIDLDTGFEIFDINEPLASLLLSWHAARAAHADGAVVELHTEAGDHYQVRSLAGPAQLTGSPAQLLGWLTGRLLPQAAEELGFPPPPTAL